MPLFRCNRCGCVENTAGSLYWIKKTGEDALCSECDPKIGKWHGYFPKKSAIGYLLGNDGFLYRKAALDAGQLQHRMDFQGFKILSTIDADPASQDKTTGGKE